MQITVSTTLNASLDAAWQAWNSPEAIMQWNAASADWHTSASEVDLREGGRFLSRMEARDGSAGFDFTGTYTRVEPERLIEYTMDDGRKVSVQFEAVAAGVKIVETFDAESTFDREQQRQGWQAILDNFARFVENHAENHA